MKNIPGLIVVLLIFISVQQTFSNNQDSLILLLEQADPVHKTEILAKLIRKNSRKQPDKAIAFGKQFFRWMDDATEEVKSNTLFDLSNSYIYKRNYDTALILLSNLVDLRHEMGDSAAKASAISQIAYVNYRSGKMNEAYNLIIKAQEISEKYSDSQYIAVDRFRHGVFAKKLSKYEEAITQYNKALEIYDAQGNEKMKASLLNNIGNLFFNLEHLDKAIQYHNEAIAVHMKLKDSLQIAGSLNDLGNSYYKKGLRDTALKCYFNAADINRRIGNDIWLAYNIQNISTIYSELGKFEDALKYAEEAMLLKEKGKDSQSLITSYATVGDIYRMKGDYTNALDYLDKALELSKKSGVSNFLINIYKKKAETYAAMGNYQKAYDMRLKYSAENDSVFNEEKISAINEIEEKYESAKKEQQIKEMEYQQNIQKSRELFLIILIAAVLLIFSLLIFAIFQKRRKDKQIHLQKEIVFKKEQELAASELEKSRIAEDKLQKTLAYKSKQLSSHALHMMQKNNMLHEIKEELKSASEKDATAVKRVNFLINESLRSDKDWDVFKLYFEEINEGFFEKVKEINPELTTNDLRLCALIKLNMNSKEMASVLNISPNSIKSARYRLKKKLELSPEADLEGFIRNIS